MTLKLLSNIDAYILVSCPSSALPYVNAKRLAKASLPTSQNLISWIDWPQNFTMVSTMDSGDGIARGFGSINRSANGFKARRVKRRDSHVVLLGNSADVTTMTSMMVASIPVSKTERRARVLISYRNRTFGDAGADGPNPPAAHKPETAPLSRRRHIPWCPRADSNRRHPL